MKKHKPTIEANIADHPTDQENDDLQDVIAQNIASASKSRGQLQLARRGPIYRARGENQHGVSQENNQHGRTQEKKMRRLTREQISDLCFFGGIILLAAILRFWHLGDRPLHHDESLHGYFSMHLLQYNIGQWAACFNNLNTISALCYRYDPLTHGPFQFHAIALIYLIANLFGVADHGINTTTVRIAAALLGTVIVALPYFLRHHLGKLTAWLACFLLAVSPSMVYYSRFAREDIYMACFTLLLVVATAQYMRTHRLFWLLIGSLAFALSYATKEATFLTIAVFGSFLGGLVAWELGMSKYLSDKWIPERLRKRLPTAALLSLGGYFILLGIFAKYFFAWLNKLSIYIAANSNDYDTGKLDIARKNLEIGIEKYVPWFGIGLASLVTIVLLCEYFGLFGFGNGRGPIRWIDSKKQPWLSTIFTMPWSYIFFAFVLTWTVFMVLFTVLFTNISGGIGDGLVKGIYYWLKQQQVARGGQPWYYYLMLIPLYEQIGLIFGLVGIIRCLCRPTRLRLFLVYWFIGNFFIYSWASEKMPWLMIHMTMPLMILAAIGLSWTINCAGTVRKKLAITRAIVGSIIALAALAVTLQNMIQVVYLHPADAHVEMMIYVQTTPNVDIVMKKIDTLDQQWSKKHHVSRYQLPIGVKDNAMWPFAWYLRDYPNTCFSFPQKCPATLNPVVILAAGDDLTPSLNQPSAEDQYGQQYNYHEYEMRAQWQQGYMPPNPPCANSTAPSANPCYIGVGALPWLSYGNNPPHPGQFNLALIAKNVWRWWWHRTPFGGIDPGYTMALFIQKGSGVQP